MTKLCGYLIFTILSTSCREAVPLSTETAVDCAEHLFDSTSALRTIDLDHFTIDVPLSTYELGDSFNTKENRYEGRLQYGCDMLWWRFGEMDWSICDHHDSYRIEHFTSDTFAASLCTNWAIYVMECRKDSLQRLVIQCYDASKKSAPLAPHYKALAIKVLKSFRFR